MIYAGTKQEIETKRKAFIRKWRLKCKAVADSLEEAGDKLFTFTRFPKSATEIDPHVERDRAIRREVQATDQDADRAAFRGNCRDVVLGSAGFWPDHDAQRGRLAKPRREAFRSDH